MTHESREQRLESILHGYLQAIDRGENPDRQAILNANPDLHDELAAYFADASKLAAMARSLRTTSFAGGASEASPSLGTIRYFGDYELLEEIARGGMGVVFKAKQVSLNRIVALKRILKGQLAGEADVRRFRQEAEAAASLDHPNIVPIYEVGEFEGEHYFSMKLIETKTVPRQHSGESQRAAVQRLAKISRAVHHAHLRGILHRDLKPSNILIDQGGDPHVADFGLAKKVQGDDNATRSGAIVGTPAYMAPEQARAEKSLTTAVDVWSLGAILYEWLTGRPPFRGDDSLATLMKVINEEPVHPRSVNPAIDRDLETICLKCLAKDPVRRYASAAELADDLDRWGRGEPIHARPAGRAERFVRWTARHPAAASAWGLLGLTLIFGSAGAVALWQWQEAEAARIVAIKARDDADIARDGERVQRERADKLVYAGQLSLAQQAGEQWDLRAAWQYLDATRREFHGWEYDYLATLLQKKQQVVHAHLHEVVCVAFSPDGTRIASASYDHTIKLADTTGTNLLTFAGHKEIVFGLAFSPDSKQIVSSSRDMTLKLWDAESGAERATLKGHKSDIVGVAFSRDGKRIASASADGALKLWDAIKGVELPVQAKQTRSPYRLAFSPDSKRLVSGNMDGTVTLWDAVTGAELLILKGQGHQGAAMGVAFSPDGKRIISGGGHSLILWDADAGVELATFKGHSEQVTSVAYSPNGQQIVSGSVDATIKLWDATSGVELLTLKGHELRVWSVAFHPDGKRIVSGSSDHTVRLWNTTAGLEAMPFNGHADHVLGVAFSPDGQRIVSAGWDKSVRLWNAATGEALFQCRDCVGMTLCVAYSPDGKRVASGNWNDGSLQIHDAETGAERMVLKGHASSIRCVAFSPNGKTIASGSSDTKVKLWDAVTGAERLTFSGHLGDVYCVAFSPDGTRIVSGDFNSSLLLWNAATGAEISTLKGHTQHVLCAAFHPDGKRIVSGGSDRLIKLWDATTGAELHTLEGHTSAVRSVAFSPDGKRIVSVSSDHTLRIWDVATGAGLFTLKGHSGEVRSVAFSPDGKRIVSASNDRTMKLWAAIPQPTKRK